MRDLGDRLPRPATAGMPCGAEPRGGADAVDHEHDRAGVAQPTPRPRRSPRLTTGSDAVEHPMTRPSRRSRRAPVAASSCCSPSSPSASPCSPGSASTSASTRRCRPSCSPIGGGLLGLALAFHLVLRWRAAYADPLLLPIATLLNGFGLVMIHRLDLAGGRTGIDSDAGRQLVWTAALGGGRGARPHPPARPPAAPALHLHRDGRRSRPAPAAAAARHRHDDLRLADLDPVGTASASSPARSRRSPSSSSSRATSSRSATSSR